MAFGLSESQSRFCDHIQNPVQARMNTKYDFIFWGLVGWESFLSL